MGRCHRASKWRSLNAQQSLKIVPNLRQWLYTLVRSYQTVLSQTLHLKDTNKTELPKYSTLKSLNREV